MREGTVGRLHVELMAETAGLQAGLSAAGQAARNVGGSLQNMEANVRSSTARLNVAGQSMRNAGSYMGDMTRRTSAANMAWSDSSDLLRRLTPELTEMEKNARSLGGVMGGELTGGYDSFLAITQNVTDTLGSMADKSASAGTLLGTIALSVGGAAAETEGYAGAAQSAELAQIALNAAMNANPYVAVASGVASLISLLGSALNTSGELTDEYKEMAAQCLVTKTSMDDLVYSAMAVAGELTKLSVGADSTETSVSGLSTALSDTAESGDAFQGVIADMLTPVGSMEEALSNLSGTFDNLEESILRSVQASYGFKIWEILQSGLSNVEKASGINTLIGEYSGFKAEVESCTGSIEAMFSGFEEGAPVTEAMVETLLAGTQAMKGYGVQITDTGTSYTEQLDLINQNYTAASAGTDALNISVEKLAGLFGEDFNTAINKTLASIAAYQEANQLSEEQVDEEIANQKKLVEMYEKKRELIVGLQTAEGQGNITALNQLKMLTDEELKIIGERDLQRIKSAENMTITLNNLQGEARNARLDAEDKLNQLMQDRDNNINQQKEANTRQFAANIQAIYSDMSAGQVNQVIDLMATSGVKMDEGYKNMIYETLGFVQETQNALESDDAAGMMDKAVDNWTEVIATGMETNKSEVQTTIDELKQYIDGISFRPLTIEFDKNIELPVFRMTGSFSTKNNSVPVVSMDWRVPEYDTGGYFTHDQIIRIAEKRPEFVGAAADLERFISSSVAQAFARVQPSRYAWEEPVYAGDTNINVNMTFHAQKITDAEMDRAYDYMMRKIARQLPRRMGAGR